MARTIVVCVPDPNGPGAPPCPGGQIATTEQVEWPFLNTGEWEWMTVTSSGGMITLWLIGLAVKKIAAVMDMGVNDE